MCQINSCSGLLECPEKKTTIYQYLLFQTDYSKTLLTLTLLYYYCSLKNTINQVPLLVLLLTNGALFCRSPAGWLGPTRDFPNNNLQNYQSTIFIYQMSKHRMYNLITVITNQFAAVVNIDSTTDSWCMMKWCTHYKIVIPVAEKQCKHTSNIGKY